MVHSTLHPTRAARLSSPALLALVLAGICLVLAAPSRADPHDHGRRDGHGFIGRRHEARHAGPGPGLSRRDDHRGQREDHRHGDFHRHRERIRNRDRRDHRELRARERWRDHPAYQRDWHEHDPWWGWSARDDDAWHHHDRFFLGFHGPGVWVHGWDDGRFGWWLSVAGSWFFYPDGVPTGQVVVVQTPPTPSDAAAAAPPPQYWYYCRAAGKYYPYVRHCPGGWHKVPAKPANP